MLKLRTDFDAAVLRKLSKHGRSVNQTRRLLALALIYDGAARHVAANSSGVTVQIIRDWVARFNSDGPDGLIDRKAKGAIPKLNSDQLVAVLQKVEDGPIPSVDGVVRWRLIDLAGWIHEEFGISIAENTLGRILKTAGYRKLSARPKHHGQNEFALEEFKKNCPPNWQKSKRAFQAEQV